MNKLQLTLAILKPNVVKQPHCVQAIRQIILGNDFKIVRSKEQRFHEREVDKFYEEHVGKGFFGSLVDFMTSGNSIFYILARENAINEWRSLMGPTKIAQALEEAPFSVRGRYAISDTENAVHGSDSPESARREIRVIFPDFQVENWYELEEPRFRAGNTIFDTNFVMHKVVPKFQPAY